MVTPYFTQHSPPALVARLPPIEQISNEDGSGGYQRPCASRLGLDLRIEEPGLDDRHHRARVDRDGPHPLRRQRDAAVDRRRAARQAGTGTPGDDRDAEARGDPQRRLHVGGGGGADDGCRSARLGGHGAVVPVALDEVGLDQDGSGGQLLDQRRDSARLRRAHGMRQGKTSTTVAPGRSCCSPSASWSASRW